MFWSEWLQAVAPAFGITASETAILMSLLGTLLFILIGLGLTRGRKPEISGGLPGILGIILFSFFGWFPWWTGTALGLIFAVVIAYVTAKNLGGEG